MHSPTVGPDIIHRFHVFRALSWLAATR